MRHLIVGCALFLCALAPVASAGGPPWISVELPADPISRAGRGAVLLVRAYSCGAPTDAKVTATAEGIVKGERQTIPLTLDATGATGVYSLRSQWPAEGTWVLSFSTSIGGDVSALVTLEPTTSAANGAEVRATTIQVVHRRVSASDVDSVVRGAAAGSRVLLAERSSSESRSLAGFAILATGSAFGVVLMRRRRRTADTAA